MFLLPSLHCEKEMYLMGHRNLPYHEWTKFLLCSLVVVTTCVVWYLQIFDSKSTYESFRNTIKCLWYV